MRVLVCGDRKWTDYKAIETRLEQLPPHSVVITGGASGVDMCAEQVCDTLSIVCDVYRAEWHRYGRAAGPIRNRVMLDLEPDLVIAFHSDITESKGTADTIREAGKRGILVELIHGGRDV